MVVVFDSSCFSISRGRSRVSSSSLLYVLLTSVLLVGLLLLPLRAAADQEADADMMMNSNNDNTLQRLHRVAQMLATTSVPMKFKFVTPLPPASLDNPPLFSEDELACTEVGQLVPIGAADPNLKDTDICSDTLTTDCWFSCSGSELVTPTRAANRASLLASIAKEIESEFVVRENTLALQFDRVACGQFNVSGYYLGNIVAVVTMRPEAALEKGSSVTLPPCEVDVVSRRPRLVHINIAPFVLDVLEVGRSTLFRSLMQGLVFNTDAIGDWLFPGTGTRYSEYSQTRFPTGALSGPSAIDVDAEGHVTFKGPRQPGQTAMLVSPTIVERAKQYFGCGTLSGIPLEDMSDSSLTGLIYFEKRVFRTELMTFPPPIANDTSHLESVFVSTFTKALFVDSGWYEQVPISTPSNVKLVFHWGLNAGCAFVTESCTAFPANYFCNDVTSKPVCGYDRLFSGTCNLRVRSSTVPSAYRVITSSKLLGSNDTIADYCPYVAPFLPSSGGLGYCDRQPAASSSSSSASSSGWEGGVSSRCFMNSVTSVSSLNISGPNNNVALLPEMPSCYHVVCVGTTLQSVKVAHTRVGNQFVPCTENAAFVFHKPGAFNVSTTSSAIPVESFDYEGMLKCGGNLQEMCRGETVWTSPYWPSVTSVEPAIGSANGGLTITLSGIALLKCDKVRIAGVTTPNVLYHYPTATLRARTEFIPFNFSGMADVELFCKLPEFCPDGCFVSRLTKSFNVTELLPCNATNDRTACLWQPICDWIDSECVDRILTLEPTAAPPPPSEEDFIVDAGCFTAAPRKCGGLDRCAMAPELCYRCERPQLQCWNGECRDNVNDCSCHPDYPFRCADGLCVTLSSDCPRTSCISPGQQLCWNRQCISSQLECPCPPNAPFLCEAATGPRACVSYPDDCLASGAAVCPLTSSSTQSNGAQQDDCPCPLTEPYKCWNNACSNSTATCACPSETPVKCASADGRCVAAASSCNASVVTNTCDRSAVRCADLQCRNDLLACPCSELALALPELQLQIANMTSFRFDQWIHIDSFISFRACGVDRTASTTVEWKVTTHSATSSAFSLRSGLTRDRVLRIPPMTLQTNATFEVTVTTTAPNSKTATASALFYTVSTSPKINVLGGNRHLSNHNEVRIEAVIDDPEYQQGNLYWSCCVSNPEGEQCISNAKCPPLFDAVNVLRKPLVVISAPSIGLPLGGYFFTAHYKKVKSSVYMLVRDAHIATCTIRMENNPGFTNEPVIVRSTILFDAHTTAKWSLNGTIRVGDPARLVLKPYTLPAIFSSRIALTVTTSSDQVSECFLVVALKAPPSQGRCFVTNDEPDSGADFRSSIVKAESMWVKIDARGWKTSTNLQYRMGFLDVATKQHVILSQDFSEIPQLRFYAPVVLNNPSVVSLRFFVHVVAAGNHYVPLGNSTCVMDVKGLVDRSSFSAFTTAMEMLRKGNESDNYASVVDVSTRASLLLADTDVPTLNRKKACSDILSSIARVVSNTTRLSLSVTRRSVCFDIVLRITPLIETFTLAQQAWSVIEVLVEARDNVQYDYQRDHGTFLVVARRVLAYNAPAALGAVKLFAVHAALRLLPGSVQDVDFGSASLTVISTSASELESHLTSRMQSLLIVPVAATQQMLLHVESKSRADHVTPQSPEGKVATSTQRFEAVRLDITVPSAFEIPDFVLKSTSSSGNQTAPSPAAGGASDSSGGGGDVPWRLVSQIVWFGVRAAGEMTATSPLDFPNNWREAATTADANITVVLHVRGDTMFTSLPLPQRNLVCMLYDASVGAWQPLNTARIGTMPAHNVSAFENSHTSCSLKVSSGIAAVFDATPADPPEVVATPAPDRDISERLSAIAEKLTPAAIAAIVLGGIFFLSAVSVLVYVKCIRKSKADKEGQAGSMQEKSQILLLSELVHDDQDLRVALDLARIRSIYHDDL